MHAFSQVLLCLEQFQKNGGLPLVIEITTDGAPAVLIINERFIQTINTGAERMYRELCEAGKEEEANQIMNDLRTYTEQTP